jgi:hypothetical protein
MNIKTITSACLAAALLSGSAYAQAGGSGGPSGNGAAGSGYSGSGDMGNQNGSTPATRDPNMGGQGGRGMMRGGNQTSPAPAGQ